MGLWSGMGRARGCRAQDRRRPLKVKDDAVVGLKNWQKENSVLSFLGFLRSTLRLLASAHDTLIPPLATPLSPRMHVDRPMKEYGSNRMKRLLWRNCRYLAGF